MGQNLQGLAPEWGLSWDPPGPRIRRVGRRHVGQRRHLDLLACFCLDNFLTVPWADFVVAGSADKTVKLWRSYECVKTMEAHTNCVRGLALNKQLGGFVTCGNDWQASPLLVPFGQTPRIKSVKSQHCSRVER